MTTANSGSESGRSLKAYEETIAAQIRAVSAKLAELEERASLRRARAEVAAIDALNDARQRLELQLHALKTAGETQASRARVEIDGALAALQTSIDEFRRKYTAGKA